MCIITATSNAFPHENNGTRVFPENNHYLMSVSLQFGRGHWNIPFGGFKLPTSELRNIEIKHTATPKTAGTRINSKHTPSHKEITNAGECVLPTIIAVSQCLLAASQHMRYTADRRQRLTAALPSRTWRQASTVRAAVRHSAASQRLVWRPVCLAGLRAKRDTDAWLSLTEGRGKKNPSPTYKLPISSERLVQGHLWADCLFSSPLPAPVEEQHRARLLKFSTLPLNVSAAHRVGVTRWRTHVQSRVNPQHLMQRMVQPGATRQF